MHLRVSLDYRAPGFARYSQVGNCQLQSRNTETYSARGLTAGNHSRKWLREYNGLDPQRNVMYVRTSLLLPNTRLCVLSKCLQEPSPSERDLPLSEEKADALAVTVTLAACTGSPGLSPPSDRPKKGQGDTRAISSPCRE